MTPAVWAPRAASVDLVLDDGSRHRLRADDDGWHRGATDLAHGTRYRFALDGSDDLLPDPRSHHQPEGVGSASAVVEHDRFRWSDDAWRGFRLPGAVLYELHIGTFTAAGTFDAAVERLDHLVDLGVSAVEVMPVAEFVGERGWGYDGVLLWAPHHAYGGPEGFKRFVDACHRRDLGVVLDVVYNHLGPAGNDLARFGPYFHDLHRTPWGDAINLDGPGAGEVRAAIVDNARHWFVDHHVDGLRLDACHALVDDSPVPLLEQLAAQVDDLATQVGRPLWLIAEDDRNMAREVLPRAAGGWGIDAQWADDLHHALHVTLTGERDGYYAAFHGLRDVAACLRDIHLARPVRPEVPGHRFVVCAQNHDQVGNRAIGDRLSHLVGPDAAMAAAAIVLCSAGTPLLFQGEEWAASSPWPYFCDVGHAPDLADAIRDGRRREFADFDWDLEQIPDPLAPATRDSAVLRWDERVEGDHARVLAWYRTLLRLRRARPSLTDGRRDLLAAHADDDLLVLRRGDTAVVANLSSEPRQVPQEWLAGARAAELLAATRDGTDLSAPVTVPATTTAVVALG